MTLFQDNEAFEMEERISTGASVAPLSPPLEATPPVTTPVGTAGPPMRTGVPPMDTGAPHVGTDAPPVSVVVPEDERQQVGSAGAGVAVLEPTVSVEGAFPARLFTQPTDRESSGPESPLRRTGSV